MLSTRSYNNIYDFRLLTQGWVYLLLVLFFIIGSIVLIMWNKEEAFLYLNGMNNPSLDRIFPIVTYAGDGWLVLIVIIILLFYKLGYALDFTIAALLSTVFVQLGKRALFADLQRPLGVFGEDLVHTIEGVKLHMARTFPSGHSTTAMLTFFYLAIISRNKGLKIVFMLMAFAGGYSRIYLGQHFFTDVYAGFAIGVLCIMLMGIWRNSFRELNWYDRKIKLF